ncbi:hypothetical protein Cfla_2894 [Cellulomonas flavigena DSM 20109]|uniref:Uncharacterized protein n=1 Tax=Cellulomonas flavigena (strain ATCC 482 / DSM 20109 / BCRC 11376 / JCM 18109 / NBRC 3775 / NCIMB 8073 / NRS 134) TaxID=446466 RepID=D5UKB6_CELFN|nr:hypothetical protein Cfla_2894 [Cellulomonas flavigena DSM 20109]
MVQARAGAAGDVGAAAADLVVVEQVVVHDHRRVQELVRGGDVRGGRDVGAAESQVRGGDQARAQELAADDGVDVLPEVGARGVVADRPAALLADQVAQDARGGHGDVLDAVRERGRVHRGPGDRRDVRGEDLRRRGRVGQGRAGAVPDGRALACLTHVAPRRSVGRILRVLRICPSATGDRVELTRHPKVFVHVRDCAFLFGREGMLPP